MNKGLLWIAVFFLLVSLGGCGKTVQTADKAAPVTVQATEPAPAAPSRKPSRWARVGKVLYRYTVRPVLYSLDPVSRLMAGQPVEDEDELTYERAFIERHEPLSHRGQ